MHILMRFHTMICQNHSGRIAQQCRMCEGATPIWKAWELRASSASRSRVGAMTLRLPCRSSASNVANSSASAATTALLCACTFKLKIENPIYRLQNLLEDPYRDSHSSICQATHTVHGLFRHMQF